MKICVSLQCQNDRDNHRDRVEVPYIDRNFIYDILYLGFIINLSYRKI